MQTAWLRVPGHVLLVRVSPMKAQLWGCSGIRMAEVRAAVKSEQTEDRPWDTVKDDLHGPAGRDFHVRRIATFVLRGLGDPREHPSGVAVDASGAPPARLYNGNHRMAAAAFLRSATIDAHVSWFDPRDLTDLLPGSIAI